MGMGNGRDGNNNGHSRTPLDGTSGRQRLIAEWAIKWLGLEMVSHDEFEVDWTTGTSKIIIAIHPVTLTSGGATTAEKLRGTKVWVAPGQRPSWVLGVGGGRPLQLWGSGGITPGKFLKTQMLNPAFWWVLAVKILAFRKLRPGSWGGPIHCWFPQPKIWGTSLLRSLWLLRLWLTLILRLVNYFVINSSLWIR